MALDIKLVKIFVEGDGDKVFIRDILKIWYGINLTKAQLTEVIIICKGFDQIANQIDEFQQTKTGQKREGGKNAVIFDSDYKGDAVYHGVEEKSKYLEEQKKKLGIDFETFLFPDNLTDGTLETVLESCINPEHKCVMDCWHSLESCIKGNGNYNIPAAKSKIYVYLECLHGKTQLEKDKIKDPNRDFTTDNWVLKVDENPFLKKLKDFLDKIFQ